MSARLDAVQPVADQAAGADQVTNNPYQFVTIPQVCLIADVCRLLRLSESQFFRLMAQRKLALVELPKWDRHRRFTGESVARVIRMRRV